MPHPSFSIERLNTPTGGILIVTDDEHRLRAVDWEDHEPRLDRLLRLLRLQQGADGIRWRDGLPPSNGANPIPIVVPCHRVIGADASLTGFGGGLDRKRWLLAHEGARAERQGDLFSAAGP